MLATGKRRDFSPAATLNADALSSLDQWALKHIAPKTLIGLVNCPAVPDAFISYRSDERDVCLSYAPTDQAIAARVIDALQRYRWIVQETDSEEDATSSQSRSARFNTKPVIVLWSSHSVGSSRVLIDAGRARSNDVLLPAFVEDVKSPPGFESLPSVDLTGWSGKLDAPQFAALLALLQSVNERRYGFLRKTMESLVGSDAERFDWRQPWNSFAGPMKALQAPTIKGELPTHTSAPSIFICYRRQDTADIAGRLDDRLAETYGRERVFMDIASVPLGIDFVDHLKEQIARCSAVIVVIGKRWLTIKDKKRRRRLDNKDDLVRAEIRAALQQKIPVIPVTVQNAPMPQADDLPDDIRPLARRNGIELSATRWRTDVERLIKELDQVIRPEILKQADKPVVSLGDKTADFESEVRRHRRQSEPALELVFDPSRIPYLQRHPLNDGTQIRMYRVGIRNISDDVIEGARAVLEDVVFLLDGVPCPLTTEHSLPIEHALNVMGIDVRDGRFKLNPGDTPSAFIDVVGQRSRDGIYMKSFSFCFAAGLSAPLQLDVDGPWLFRLRIEGGASPIKASFTVGADEGGLMVMNQWKK